MNPSATVVITTKNRKEDLARAVESALAQTTGPQVLVVDDGSTDGTSEMLRDKFPAATIERVEQSRGYIVQRNRGAGLAAGNIIFSIDDDAAFSTPNVVAQTLAEFDNERIGAVGIPFIDVNRTPEVRQRAPESGFFVTSGYIGTAHAIRRDLFLKLGGYREFLFHQGEESDLAIRMLDAGYVVRLGNADVIHHFESPRRDFRRMDLYGRRNDVLFAWHNVPMPELIAHLIGTTIGGIRFGVKYGRPFRMTQGLAYGYGAIFKRLGARKAVSRATYRLNRLLKQRGAVPFEEIAALLPALSPDLISSV